MDEIMDTKVVQMKFDNSQFRAGVQDTIKQLEHLENSLELDGASTGLDQIAKASKQTTKSMNEVGSAVDQIQRHFSALEVVGITVMMRLTNAALNYGKKITTALWSPIVEGGKRRSQNIEQAKFQLEGLGVAWNDISEDINYGVKDTAYGLDEAAKAASQMVASLDLSHGYTSDMSEQMKKSLRAISGVAAMTSSSYSEIADIFTTVSSNGKLMTMQLRQLSARGLNASAILARALNKTEEEINDMVTKGKIGFAEFANAMDDAFGEHAKEANKTFQGALSNVKAALGRIGAKFADPVYESLRRIFNGFIPVVNNINKALEPIVTAFSKITEIAGTWLAEFLKVEDVSRFLMQMAINLYSYLRPIIIAFVEVFAKYVPMIDRSASSMEEFARQFVLVGDNAEKFKDICKAVFSTVDLLIHVGVAGFKLISSILKGMLGIVEKLSKRTVTFFSNRGLNVTAIHLWQIVNALTALVDMASKFVQTKIEVAFDKLAGVLASLNWAKILDTISKIIIVISVAWQLIVKLVELAIDGFTRLLPILRVVTASIISFVTTTAYALALFGTLIAGIFGKGRSFLSGIGQSVRGLSNGSELDSVTESISNISDETENVTESVDSASEALDEMSDRVQVIGKNAQRTSKDISGLREEIGALDSETKGMEASNNKHDRTLSSQVPLLDSGRTSDTALNRLSSDSIGGQKKVGFFTNLVSYFMSDQDNAIAIAATRIDAFFGSIIRYLRNVVGEFIYNLESFLGVETFFDALDAIINKIFKYGSLLMLAKLWFSVYNTLVAIFDLLPALARLINAGALALATYNVSKILQSTLAFFIGLSVFLVALEYTMERMKVEELENTLNVLSNFLIRIIQKVLWFAIAFQGIIVLGQILSELPNIIRLITGRELRDSGMTKFLKFMQALATFLLTFSVSFYIITHVLKTTETKDIIAAGVMVAGIMYAVVAFIFVLVAMGYKLDKGVDTLSITRKGITRQVTRFQDYIADIFLSVAVLVLTIVGSMYAILMLQSQFSWPNMWIAFGMISAIFGVLFVFAALLMSATKKLMPQVDSFTTAEKVMEGVVKSIRAMKGVILALGLSVLMLAGALFVVSKVEITEQNKSAFRLFTVLSLLIMGITVGIALIAKFTGADLDRKIITTSIMIASVAFSITAIMAATAYLMKALEEVSIKSEDINNILGFITLVTLIVGLVTAAAVFGSTIKGANIIGALVSLSVLMAVMSGFILAIGGSIKLMADAVGDTKNLIPIFKQLFLIMLEITAIITVLSVVSALPGVGEIVIATLGILSIVFGSLAILFVSIGVAAVLIGIGVKKLAEAIDQFVNINWDTAARSTVSLLAFTTSLNTAAMTISPFTLVGLLGLSVVASAAAKAIKALSGIDAKSAMKSADALGTFIETLTDYRRDLERFKDMVEVLTGIAWLAAVLVAGLVIAGGELVVVGAELAIFAGIMWLCGDKIKEAFETFFNALDYACDRVLTNLPTLAGGTGWLMVIAAMLTIGAAGLLAGSALLWLASGFMEKASEVMVTSFAHFIEALNQIGLMANATLPFINALLPGLVAMGGVTILVGGMLLIGAGLFFGAGLLFSLGSVIIGWGLETTMEEVNNFLVGFIEFVDNFEAAVFRLVESMNTLGMFGLSGLIIGIANNSQSAYEAGDETAEEFYNGAADNLEVESPSKRMIRFAGYVIDGLVIGTKNNAARAENSGKLVSDSYEKGFDSDGLINLTKNTAINQGKAYGVGLKAAAPDVGRESNQFAAQQAEEIQNGAAENVEAVEDAGGSYATAISDGVEEQEPTVRSKVSNFVNGVADFFDVDLSGLGDGSVSSWFTGVLESLGVNVEGIKSKVYGIGTIIGALLGDGAGNAIDAAFRAIAKMLSTNMTAAQNATIEFAGGMDSEVGQRMYNESRRSNENTWYDTLRNWKDFLPEIPSVDDFLGGAGGGGGGYSSDYTSDLASSISGSSGAGSGINDTSKAGSIGGGVGNTITNSNNTYNFTQNNYSPEALNRSEIYQQTRSQFSTFYGFMREKNPAF